MEKSWDNDIESQIAKVEKILESMNKDKEEVIPEAEGKRLDLEARIDFDEKLARKIKAVGFKEGAADENQNQCNSFNKLISYFQKKKKLISKKLGKLRIECAADQEEKEDQIKLMKEQFEEFALRFEKQIEDQQKINEELKKQLSEVEKKQSVDAAVDGGRPTERRGLSAFANNLQRQIELAQEQSQLQIQNYILQEQLAQQKNQRTLLGEKLYPLVYQLEHENAGKVTGMLLELDQTEVLHLLDSHQALKSRVAEAMQVLRKYFGPQANSAADSKED
ncbi:Polyadenylate-binding protein/Hyperplastic disc protein [Corchorus olitorius]|uniref:Polyadenylate-binding protein/Hyperplastic disc protein n=1 Tax=Corchorus olitorius TaxID=93759 RepID=A0A1R3HT42_9ROSI|nr:Polyadenylate-binding protein/Hyperplastic disc protein [Corchorus olitorius]